MPHAPILEYYLDYTVLFQPLLTFNAYGHDKWSDLWFVKQIDSKAVEIFDQNGIDQYYWWRLANMLCNIDLALSRSLLFPIIF